VDVTVERADWEPVRPTASPNPARVYFVDGVRRVEHRLLVEGDEGSLYGLLGSFGVGAACLGNKSARITHEHIGRLCVVGGGVLLPGVNAPVPAGRFTLAFEPRLVPENTPMAPLDGLQTAMREGEALLAEALGNEAELDAGNIEAVLCALRVHSPKDDEARKCVDYVDANRARMRYAEFRAAGLCTSTGVVEAGCKTTIGTRCKRAGIHWTVAGVDAIIVLRCCKLSGRFEDFWERRAQRRVAA
jgi:hypothetical protein